MITLLKILHALLGLFKEFKAVQKAQRLQNIKTAVKGMSMKKLRGNLKILSKKKEK